MSGHVNTAAHTPHAHAFHRNPCGCSTDRRTDFAVCMCGAAYTSDVLTFIYFRCYDCNRVNDFTLDYAADNERNLCQSQP